MKLLQGNRFFALIAFVLLVTALPAFSGQIRGVVTDASTGNSLPGANVYLEGTSIGASTDFDGEFNILKVPSGVYTLQVTYMGYKTYAELIRIKEEEELNIDVGLEYDVVEMDASVVITAQREGQVKAINQQLTASTIMNVVSQDRIQELPDANAAESIGRISGVSIRRNAGEGQQVVIRGLEPKLNTITVNGVRIPSSDSENRSVDLSMISADALSGIEVFKAPTPDMDAEAFGGTVNLVLKQAPDDFQGFFKVMGGYSSLANYFGNIKVNGQVSRRFFNTNLGVVASGYYESRNRDADNFRANYSIQGDDEAVKTVADQAIYSDDLERRKRWGGSLNLDYILSPEHVISVTNFYSKKTRDLFQRTQDFNLGTANSNTVETAGTVTERSTSLLSNGLSGMHTFSDVKMNWGFTRFATYNYMPYNFELRFRETSAFTSLPFEDHPSTFPDYAKNNLENTVLQRARMTQDTVKDINYTAQLNFEMPLRLSNKLTTMLKFGGKYTQVDKERVRQREGEYFYYLGGSFVKKAIDAHPANLTLTDNGFIAIHDLVDDYEGVDDFLGWGNALAPTLSESGIRNWYTHHNGYFTNDRDMLGDVYDVKETVSAGYIMGKINYGQLLMILPGVRYEKSDNEYQAVYAVTSELYGRTGTNRDTTTTQNYEEWCPHLHIKFKPLETFDLRASFTKTLARPDFSYITPRTRIDKEDNRIFAGNPNLKHATSFNYDLIASYYHNRIGLITVAGFYKSIDNIFYPKREIIVTDERTEELGYTDPVYRTGYELRWFTNSKEATVYGFEVDLQTQLRFMPGPLKGLVLNANYSRFYSETFFPQYDYEVNFEFIDGKYVLNTHYEEFFRKSKMPGQADQIANIALGYDIGGFSSRVSIFYQGASLFAVGGIAEQDQYTDDYWRWDASFKQKFNDHVSVFLNLVNLTSTKEVSFYGANDYETLIEKFGMTADFGIQYSF